MVSKSDDEINALLSDGESLVCRFAAQAGRLPAMDYEDVCQELRIHALGAARRFAASAGVPWLAYLATILRRRLIDVKRAHGVWTRDGNQKDQQHYGLDLLQNTGSHIDLLTPEDPGREAADVEWRDLVRQSEWESPQVQSIVLHCSGVTTQEIGQRFGYSRSWASDLINPNHPLRADAVTRLRVLTGIERRRKPQATMGRN